MKNLLLFLIACGAMCLPFAAKAQGISTASIQGQIIDTDGAPIPGAIVTLLFKPTNAVHNTVSGASGNFYFPNLQVGGPYELQIEMAGFQNYTQTIIELQLGEHLRVRPQLSLNSVDLPITEVTAPPTPSTTTWDQRDLLSLPNLDRSLTEFTRLSPAANNQGFLGQSSRYNLVSIDGNLFNNAFGLGGSRQTLIGTAAGAQPVSLDAIQQLSVNLAPFDVRTGGFTGASINAVTRSGTNNWEGSVYEFHSSDKLTGTEVGGEEVSLNNFQRNLFGARVGGPIIKDQLFFFFSYEGERRSEPASPFSAARPGNEGDQVSRVLASDLDDMQTFLNDAYGYQTGAYEDYNFLTQNDKILLRLDWNIANKHQLTLRYNYLQAEQDRPVSNTRQFGAGDRFNSATSMSFRSSNWKRSAQIHAFAAELNSSFGSNANNQLRINYTFYPEERAINGVLFPMVDILQSGQTYMSFGADMFANNHRAHSKIFQIQDNYSIHTDKHVFTIGMSYEQLQFDYVVTPAYAGSYIFDSLEDFYNSSPIGTLTPVGLSNGIGRPSTYTLNYSTFEDGRLPKASPSSGQLGFYLQDEYYPSANFKLQYGLRVDYIRFFDELTENTAISDLEFQNPEGNSYSINTGELPGSQLLWSPRVHFSWDIAPKLQLRGGSGLFTGRIPFVILSSQYVENGLVQAQIRARNNQANQFPFNPAPNAYIPSDRATNNNYDIVVNSPDLKMPQIWRSNLGLDVQLPLNITASADIYYTRNIHDIYAWNANLDQSNTEKADDGRIQFSNNRLNNPPVLNAYVLDNISEGDQFYTILQLKKKWHDNWLASLSYTFGESRNISSFTGTGPVQAYRSNPIVNNPNRPILAFSDEDLRHRVLGVLSYRLAYAKSLATTFSLLIDGVQAGRYSFTYSSNGDVNKDGVPANDLIFVPASQDQIQLEAYNQQGNQVTVEEQWAALEQFIEQSDYLRSRKGDFAERNGAILPFVTQLHLRVMQDIAFQIGQKKHGFQLSLDINNFGNLLNSSWGVFELPAVTQPIQARQNGNFRVSPNLLQSERINDTSLQSLWQMQVGIRYYFE